MVFLEQLLSFETDNFKNNYREVSEKAFFSAHFFILSYLLKQLGQAGRKYKHRQRKFSTLFYSV